MVKDIVIWISLAEAPTPGCLLLAGFLCSSPLFNLYSPLMGLEKNNDFHFKDREAETHSYVTCSWPVRLGTQICICLAKSRKSFSKGNPVFYLE